MRHLGRAAAAHPKDLRPIKYGQRLRRGIILQPDDPVARRAVKGSDGTAQKNLAIHLQRGTVRKIVRAGTGIEARIQTAVGIESGNAVARSAAHGGESAAKEHFPISL